jgi:hypothetical protein
MSKTVWGNMLPHYPPSVSWIKKVLQLIGVILLFTLVGCTLSSNEPSFEQNPPPIEKAQVVFGVVPTEDIQEGESIELVILDEVTGLPFNQERITMELFEDTQYYAVYEAPIGTVIPFRFEKINQDGVRIPEVGVDGVPIRYRLYRVDGPAVASDTIAGWEDKLPETDNYGYITGKVVRREIGDPLKDILVTAGGVQAITDAEGKFTLSPLIPGQHTLIAYSMDGSYIPSHIEAGIAKNEVTNATLEMTPSSWKDVTFMVEIPEDTFSGAPIRMAGNLAQFGNTFVELGGGMSGDIKLMPVLSETDSKYFTVKLTLPAEIDIRYKYTLGDGFWNAEHGLNKSFVVHQLIIPDSARDITIYDRVATWKSSDTETVWFQVVVPENTPDEELIGIQFSIAEWMPALPMFKIKENQWAYPLISPHNFSGEIPYRYCRSTPCTGNFQTGVESLPLPRTSDTLFSKAIVVNDQVEKWAFLSPTEAATGIPVTKPNNREDFIAGLALSPNYTPTALPYISTLLQTSQNAINHIVLSPAWTASSPAPPTFFEISVDGTPRWSQLISEIEIAHTTNLTVSLFPTVNFPTNPLNWWEALKTDEEANWALLLAQYQDFIYQYATLAELTGTETLVIGGDWLIPTLPVSDNAERYHQPGNIQSIWEELIAGIRERFHGEIAWQVSLEIAKQPPAFLSAVDKLYIKWDLAPDPNDPEIDLNTFISENLDSLALPLHNDLGKPVILMLAYPSLEGYGAECIPSPVDEGSCIDTSALLLGPAGENPAAADLQAQANYYAAFLSAVAERSWIDGVISQGYSPALQLHDSSASINGKPAESILLDWFSSVLGN